MIRIKWNYEKIESWLKLNRPDIKLIETKIENKQRLVYIEYNNNEGWVQWGNIQKGFNPSFKIQAYTTESFSNILSKKHSNVKLLESFKGVKTIHKFYCNECDKYFENTPDNILTSKYGCFNCYLREKGKDRLRNQIEFEELIFNLSKGEYEVTGEYVNSQTKIKFKHNTCNREFNMKPNNFTSQGNRCPHCAKDNHGLKKRKLHEDFIEDINEKYPNKYTILSKYEVQSKKIKVKYNDCGHIKMVYPNSIMRGYGCDECAKIIRGEKRRKSKEQFESELNLKFPDRFEILEYDKQSSELKVLHKDCNNIFYRMGGDLLQNGACDFCNMSSQEETVKNVLEHYDIKFTPQKTFDGCKNIKLLRFDFYLEGLNILLEVQGRQHYTVIEHFGGFKGFMERKFNDIRKQVFCKKNNIILLEIPYWENEFKKVEKILKEHDII